MFCEWILTSMQKFTFEIINIWGFATLQNVNELKFFIKSINVDHLNPHSTFQRKFVTSVNGNLRNMNGIF